MISSSNSLSRGSGMLYQVDDALLHAMSATELSRVRTELQLLLPKAINKSLITSRGPTLLCNHVNRARCVFVRFEGVALEPAGSERFYSQGSLPLKAPLL